MKISVIVPVYNAASYLAECLDSIVAQSFGGWECVCVDDGATDGSGAILDDYATKDNRFRVVHQTNTGVSAARNAGLAIAFGEWVTFVDADDVLEPNFLAEAMRIISRENPDLLRMKDLHFSEVVPQPGNSADMAEYRVLARRDEILDWGWDLLGYDRSTWAQFQRTEDARKIGFAVGVTYCEDSARNLKVLETLKKVCVSDYVGYFYRIRPDSSRAQVLSAEERVRFFGMCGETLPPEIKKRRYAHYVWENLLAWYAWRGEGKRVDEEKVRAAFLQVVKAAGIRACDMKTHWKCPFWLYAKLGIAWPMRLTRRVLMPIKGVAR